MPEGQMFDSAQAERMATPPGWQSLQADEVTADALTGAPVIDENFTEIGTVSELLVDIRGQLTEARLRIGGTIFGIGATDVLVSMDELNIQRDLDGDDIQVRIEATKDALIARSGQ